MWDTPAVSSVRARVTLPDGTQEWRDVPRWALNMMVSQLRLPIRRGQALAGLRLEVPADSQESL